jgi:hypothetical protein
MIKLKQILEQAEQGSFYDWTRDFDAFKNSINSVTESAKNKFEKALAAKIMNKSVMVRASKAQPKQPVKDYTIDRVTAVNIVDYFDEWTVVIKNQSGKEYCLVSGFKIKILGTAVAQEPGSAETPQQAEPVVQPQIGKPAAPQPQPNPQTNPKPPLKEGNQLTYLDNNYWILSPRQAKDLSIDGTLPKPGYEKKADVSKLKNYVFNSRRTPNSPIDVSNIKTGWIHQTPHGNELVWSIRLN